MCDLEAVASRAPRSSSGSRRSNAELEARGLVRPHYWLSDEWFTPDGVPGVAVPFYLAHPRLAKLELAQMLEVEGGDEETCLKILRHEAGHAIDNAYQLRRRPDAPTAVRHARHAVSRVLHAEAVQQELRAAPRSLVRAEPSRRGLRGDVRRLARSAVELVHPLRGMARAPQARIHGSTDARCWPGTEPRIRSKRQVDPIRTAAQDARRALPEETRALRARSSGFLRKRPAQSVLRRAGVRRRTCRPRGSCDAFGRTCAAPSQASPTRYQYTIEQLIEKIIERCRELNLRLTDSEESTKTDFMVFLTVQTMNYLHSGRHRVAL